MSKGIADIVIFQRKLKQIYTSSLVFSMVCVDVSYIF